MKKSFLAAAILLATLSPMVALAIDIPATGPGPGIRTFEGFLGIFDTIIKWLFTILLVMAVLMIIYAAFLYLTSGGDEEKTSKAHKTIIYAVVAIAVAFLAQGVSFVVAQLLGQ
jgi:hypothetical protein